jgi:hypothetical protein
MTCGSIAWSARNVRVDVTVVLLGRWLMAMLEDVKRSIEQWTRIARPAPTALAGLVRPRNAKRC